MGWIYLRSLVLKEHRQSDANKAQKPQCRRCIQYAEKISFTAFLQPCELVFFNISEKTGVEWFAGECRWKSPRLHRLHRHRLWLVRMKNCFELTKWSWLPQTIHPNPNINFKEIILLGNGVIEVFVELEVNLEVHTVGGWGHEAIASAWTKIFN